jgi:glutamate dehydrogenase (NAD(P)+)
MVNYDEFGPELIYDVYDPKTNLRGFVVIDNLALGAAKGGIRMTPSVSVEEVCKLARTMTWKNSLAGLPFGGGKAGIIADDRKMTPDQKSNLMKSFGKALRPISPKYYVAGPDMNTSEIDMKSFVEGNGSLKSATGKPADLCEKPGVRCGIPHEYGSTGFGVFHSTMVALKYAKLSKDCTVAIEGFGNVGTFIMKYLTEAGAKVVAVSDSKGTIYNADGLDFKALLDIKTKSGSVLNYTPGEKKSNGALFELEVDVLIPSAIPDVINAGNADKVKAKLVVEGANIPATPEIEQKLYQRNIVVVPDFVANAGGVISSYAEYKGKKPEEMFKMVERKIRFNTKKVLRRSKKEKIYPRDAAMKIAVERVKNAMGSSVQKEEKPQAPAVDEKPQDSA